MGLTVYILFFLCVSVFAISDKRLCADPNCEVLISYARVEIPYVAIEKDKIDLKRGQIVKVYGKEAGKDTSLWEVEVEGRRGYAPKTFLKETQTFYKELKYEVDTKIEITSETTGPDINTPAENASSVPSISNSFDVVDGTTIYANPAGDVLETQPIQTIAFNTQQSDDIQSSKTIDATSISKNKLDEPNSSLILPQPTTSSPPLYSASGGENLRDAKADVFYEEDVKKSALDSSETETSEENHKNTKIFEDLSSNEDYFKLSNADESNILNKEDASAEDESTQDDYDDEFEDVSEGDEDEEDEEDEDEDEKGTETSVEEEERKEFDSAGDAASNGRDLNDEKETINLALKEQDSSEPVIADSSVGLTDTLDEKSMEVSIQDGSENNGHDREAEETKSKSEESKLQDIPTTSEPINALDVNLSAQEYSFRDSEGQIEVTDAIDVNNSRKRETTESAGFDEQVELRSTSATSGEDIVGMSEERDALLEEGVNSKVSNKAMGDFVPPSTSSGENLNTVGPEDVQEEKVAEGKREAIFSFHSSLGQWNEVAQGDKQEAIEENIQTEDATSAESNEFPRIPVTTDVFTEETSAERPVEDGPGQYTTEEYSSMPQQVNTVEQPENQKDTEPSLSYQQDDTPEDEETVVKDFSSNIVETNTMETSSEVQSTCDMSSPSCESETEELPEELASVEDAEKGWFSSLTEKASFDSDVLMGKEMQKNSFDTLLYLMVTAITVLVFSLGYYYIEKQRRDGSLIAKINKLEKELMVSSQEKFELKDELENLSSLKTSPDSGETCSALQDEYEESKNARAELEEQVASLEKELEAATEAGLELNRMMSELLSAQHGSDTLMKSVEHLQKQLDSQQSTISTMNACLTAKNLENENLQSELNLASERVQNLEEDLCKVNESLTSVQKEKSEIEHDFQMKNQSIESQLVEALESKSADSQRLCRELDALQDVLDETRKTLAAREGEVSVLRECLSHAECLSSGGESNVSLEALLDVGHLRAKIDAVTKDRDELQEKLQGEEDARKLLEDHMKIVSEEVSTLRSKYEEADRGKMEAQTRLEVLSNYFKEKETQLQKELGLQEAMYIQKEGDALSTIEQIKAFQEEIENYKAQNEILKKEIVDQERSMKSQIAMLEKKAHENWVAARQAERRLEESKQEASQLRNRLTLSGRRIVGTIPGPDVGKPPERGTLDLERNGEMSSPAHMGDTQELQSSPLHFGLPASPPLLPPSGQPLPPGPFPSMPLGVFLPPGAPGMPFPMPPPPGGLFPDDLRPPPLGRMSSPPPEPHRSFSPFDHSPPMSPHSRPYRSPLHYEDSPNRYRHQTPPLTGAPSFASPFPHGKWDDRSEPPRSSFRPLHRDSPREPKGSTLSSGHSSESLDKGSRHSRV